ncbi:MAG: CorA family divalent cation transporter, partial [Christensenella sp.]|uniref:magnesium transporter CorA family protein n=1 Tax=Christensenella sp. TaxID=1935934 RepID=UPI002B1F8252
MLYEIMNGAMSPAKAIDSQKSTEYVSVSTTKEVSTYLTDIPADMLPQILENTSIRFESHEDFDLLCIPFYEFEHRLRDSPPIYIFLHPGHLHFVCDQCSELASLLDRFAHLNKSEASIGRLVCAFFEYILDDDLESLDKIEEQIGDLEDDVLTDKQGNFTKTIIDKRKHLMVIMRYYEQLLNILESLSMNEKHIFSKNSVRFLNIIYGKTQRLYDKTKSLREYVSEIREAYQAEVDLRMNNIMKILTIITMIFMPLTLIVGWYGMNLKMPEYAAPFAYPVVIAISLMIVVVSI